MHTWNNSQHPKSRKLAPWTCSSLFGETAAECSHSHVSRFLPPVGKHLWFVAWKRVRLLRCSDMFICVYSVGAQVQASNTRSFRFRVYTVGIPVGQRNMGWQLQGKGVRERAWAHGSSGSRGTKSYQKLRLWQRHDQPRHPKVPCFCFVLCNQKPPKSMAPLAVLEDSWNTSKDPKLLILWAGETRTKHPKLIYSF